VRPGASTHPGIRGSLALILIGIVLPLAVVGLLVERVWRGEDLVWELELMRSVHHREGPILDVPAIGLSIVGTGAVLAVIVTAAVIVLVRCGRRADAVFLVVAVGGAAVIENVAKLIVRRPRPELWEPVWSAHGYSFPSGHATTSMALAAAATALAWDTRWRWWAFAGGAVFTLSVGASRVYLGVHHPSDVIAGWCAGLAWVSGLILLRTARRRAGPPGG
jgi:undecaprenyl-diphosphatase